MAPFRTTAVIPLSPYLQIHSHHSFIPFIPSRFHCVYPSIHNNLSPPLRYEQKRAKSPPFGITTPYRPYS